MSENKEDLFGKLKKAFENASEFLDLKNKVEPSIFEISEMLKTMTNGEAFFVIIQEMRPGYGATNFIKVRRKDDGGILDIFLCGFIMDDIQGFPVHLETKDYAWSCDTPEMLKESLVDLISSPETAVKILSMINQEHPNDIPF